MKQGWEIKKLTEVVWFQEGPGVRKHQYTSSGVKLLNVANLVNGKVDLSTSDRYISSEEAYGKYKHFLVDEGDLILASSGIQVEYIEKKMGFIEKHHLPLCMNTSTIRFKSIDKNVLDITYFMYFLKSYCFKEQLFRLITGVAQLNYGPSHLKQMSIPVPPLPEQEKIVAELDCLSGIIEKKKQQLKEYDALAQSIFYEMFGNPIDNEKGWNKIRIGEFSTCIAGATPSTKVDDYWNNGNIPWLSSGEVGKGRIYETDKCITQTGYDSCSTRLIPPHTIVMAMAGQGKTRGTVGVVEISCCTNQSICSIVTNDTVDVDFLYYQLALLYQELRNISNGDGGRGGLNLKLIQNFRIIAPPLDMQKQFAKKILHIEKQKELIKQSIAETETLFNSRMDYYFN